MKTKLTFIIVIMAMSSIAQNYAVVSGVVTDITNGNPLPNQSVFIYADSAQSYSSPVGFSYFSIKNTDSNGFYLDSIPLTSNNVVYSQGVVFVSLFDCQNFQSDTVSFSTGNYSFNTNFSICQPNDSIDSISYYGCNASFEVSQYSGTTFAFTSYSNANLDGVDSIVTTTWDFGDGTSNEGNFITHSYVVSGTYNVRLTIFTLEGCSSSLELVVETDYVIGSCASYFEIFNDPSQPFTYTLFDSSMAGNPYQNIVSFSWDFGDGTASDDWWMPTHTYSLPGVYQISHTITTASGCSSTYTQNVVVDSICYLYVAETYIMNESSPGASDGSIEITAIGTPPFQFYWSNTDTTQNIYGLEAGYYYVTVTDQSGCQTWSTFEIHNETDSIYWGYTDTLETTPIDTCFNYNPGSAAIYNFILSANDSITFTWIIYDSTGSLHNFITETYFVDSTSAGFFTAFLSLSCDAEGSGLNVSRFSDNIHLQLEPAGINSMTNVSENISVFPNPVEDRLNISFKLGKSDQVTIEILNALGQVIQSEKAIYDNGQKVVTINTSSLAKGLYFVRLNSNGETSSSRFVK